MKFTSHPVCTLKTCVNNHKRRGKVNIEIIDFQVKKSRIEKSDWFFSLLLFSSDHCFQQISFSFISSLKHLKLDYFSYIFSILSFWTKNDHLTHCVMWKKAIMNLRVSPFFISFINELVFCLAMWVIHCILDDLPGRFCNEVSRVARNRFGESFCGSKSWIFFCLQVIFKDIRSLETISNGHNTVKMGESRRDN